MLKVCTIGIISYYFPSYFDINIRTQLLTEMTLEKSVKGLKKSYRLV